MASDRKWALITGVSQGGLGDALALELLARNVNVIASGLDLSLLQHLPAEPGRLEHVELDVTSDSSISSAVKQVEHITNGKLDILINNAGYGYHMPLMDADLDAVKRNYDVNVFGLLAVTKAFFPLLRAAKGMVVMQSSIACLPGVSQPFIATYSSSKAAVTQMSDALRVELDPFGIKVSHACKQRLCSY